MSGPRGPINKEFVTGCPACGGKEFSAIKRRDYESDTGEYSVERCRQCNVRFTNPRPAMDANFALYRDRDSADYVRSGGIAQRLRALAIRRWIRKIIGLCDGHESVLDFGCGDGFFAAQLARFPAFERITAVDLHERPPRCLDGHLSVHYRSYEQLQAVDRPYQLVFCRHVMEHVADPVAVTANLRRLTAPGGTLVVEVPNHQSVWRKLFGRYYFGLYLPRHLLHFDECMLKKMFCEYRQIKLYRNHTPVLGKSLGYLTGLGIGNLGPIGLGLFPLQILVDSAARSSSVLSLVLRKQM